MAQRDDLETGNTALSPGETEITVERLFADMLGISDLPRTASFFDQGLDSLSVTVACAQLEQATGVRVRFSQLFRTPTVAQLAAWIDSARDGLNGGPAIAMGSPASEGAALVALTPRQAHTVPMGIVMEMAWWFDGEIDDAALENAASDVHRRHQALHASYLDGPELGLAEVPADPGQAEFHRLPPEDSDAAALEAILRTLEQPLRLSEGEIWRCAIVRCSQSGRTLFGLAVNHAAFDGRSISIMTAELSTAYAARAAGTPPQWPGRVASLAETAADYRHQLAAQGADAQRRYWRDELRDLPACHLPGRRNDALSYSGPAFERSFTVSKAQLRSWEDYARVNGMSASVGVAAAYVQAIIRVGGPRDFGLMVGLANWAGETINRTIMNRVGNIFLRPNGPSRSGPHILVRMRDTYRQAMAARDVLIDPSEYPKLFNNEDMGGMSIFRDMPHIVYNSYPALSLGGLTGMFAPEFSAWEDCGRELMLEVVRAPEGLAMHMIVRTDRYEAGLADRISEHIMDIIREGPEQLELESARSEASFGSATA